MPKIPIVKAKIFYQMLVKFGCEPISVRISHFKVRNPHNGKVSVVTIHTGKDFSKGAFVSTLKQLGIDVESFLVFIDKQ